MFELKLDVINKTKNTRNQSNVERATFSLGGIYVLMPCIFCRIDLLSIRLPYFIIHGSYLWMMKPASSQSRRQDAVRRYDWLKLIVLKVVTQMILRLIGLLYITLTTIPHRQKGSARVRARACAMTNVWALHCPQIRPSNKNRSGQASEPCK